MKKTLTSLLLISPIVLGACHGPTISRADAQKIVSDIQKKYVDVEDLPFEVFTLLISVDETNELNPQKLDKIETKHFYSIKDKYYYTYTYQNGSVSEQWHYVKHDAEAEEDYIYSVNRVIDSSIKDDPTPKYEYTKDVFDEEVWEELNATYVHVLTKETETLLSGIYSYLESEPGEGSEIILESYGSGNLYAKRTIVDSEGKLTYEKEAQFTDNRLVSFNYKAANPQRNRKYSITYTSSEIFYPSITE